jgi:predicted XRE-type DNA-binding protein
MKKSNIKYTTSSGNIYKDLGFADAEERLPKAKLAMKINDLIDERHLNQTEIAKLLGITQPKVSALMNGNLAGFSLEKLLKFLTLLNQDINITVKEKSKSTAIGQLKIAI